MSASRFRKVALALPGAVEGAHRGHADFRLGKRIFATLGYPDADWGVVKLTPEQQAVLVEAEPDIFRGVPGGWGKSGNTNVRLAKADAATLQSALTMAWHNIAPKAPRAGRRRNSAANLRATSAIIRSFREIEGGRRSAAMVSSVRHDAFFCGDRP
jgi:hypothetical protein